MGSIPRVDDRRIDTPRQKMGRTGALMPDNHHIDLHRADIAYGILKRLSLSGTGCTGREVDHIGPHPFLGKLKREAGLGTVFIEKYLYMGIPASGVITEWNYVICLVKFLSAH